MRHKCTLFALAFVLGASAMASEREEIYARQLDCATLKVLKGRTANAEQFEAKLTDAVDDCVTVQDMKASYKGYKRYEERNPETVRMEREERKGYLVNGVLQQIETCRRSGMGNGIAAQSCSVFLGAQKGG